MKLIATALVTLAAIAFAAPADARPLPRDKQHFPTAVTVCPRPVPGHQSCFIVYIP